MRILALFLSFLVSFQMAMAFDLTLEEIEEHFLLLEHLEAQEGSDVIDRFELGTMKDWLKEKALGLKDKAKEAFLNNGGVEMLKKGKALMDALQVKVGALKCEKNLCKSCISINAFPMNGQSACASFGIVDKLTIGCSLSVNGYEVIEQYLGLKSFKAACAPLPFPMGSVCLQGLDYSQNKEKKEKRLCLVAALSQFSVGAKMCATQSPTGLTPSIEKLEAQAIAEYDRFLFTYDGKRPIGNCGVSRNNCSGWKSSSLGLLRVADKWAGGGGQFRGGPMNDSHAPICARAVRKFESATSPLSGVEFGQTAVATKNPKQSKVQTERKKLVKLAIKTHYFACSKLLGNDRRANHWHAGHCYKLETKYCHIVTKSKLKRTRIKNRPSKRKMGPRDRNHGEEGINYGALGLWLESFFICWFFLVHQLKASNIAFKQNIKQLKYEE